MDDLEESVPFAPSDEGKQPLDLWMLVLMAMVSVVSALLLPDGNPARTALTLPLLILYPGYAAVSVLWPENNEEGKSVDMLARIALSIGLSIVIISLTGFILSMADMLMLNGVLAGNTAIIVILVVAAFFRRNMLPPEKRFSIGLSKPTGGSESIFMALIIAGIVVLSGFASYSIFTPVDNDSYSEFYIFDSNRTTQNYPVNISVNDTATIILGVANHEGADATYSIHTLCGNFSSPAVLHAWNMTLPLSNSTHVYRDVRIQDGTIFEDTMNFRFTEPGQYMVSWVLLLDGQPSDYELHLWIKVNP